MEIAPKHKNSAQNAGKIISVRSSVVDVWGSNDILGGVKESRNGINYKVWE